MASSKLTLDELKQQKQIWMAGRAAALEREALRSGMREYIIAQQM
jgi:hypothetical protein